MTNYRLVSFRGGSVEEVTEQVNDFFKQNSGKNMAVAKFSVTERDSGVTVFMLCLDE